MARIGRCRMRVRRMQRASCAEPLAQASLHAVPATFATMAPRTFHFAVIGMPVLMRATIVRRLGPRHPQPGAQGRARQTAGSRPVRRIPNSFTRIREKCCVIAAWFI
ncbi:hypothetical protein WS68_16970 [Burkholderia sp. TSV86]|nr:hypothetical protein WS68_16970 [Burkholderia sp. TSV86]